MRNPRRDKPDAMNVFVWSIALTLVGAALVGASLAAPILVAPGLFLAAVGLLMAVVSILLDLETPGHGGRPL